MRGAVDNWRAAKNKTTWLVSVQVGPRSRHSAVARALRPVREKEISHHNNILHQKQICIFSFSFGEGEERGRRGEEDERRRGHEGRRRRGEEEGGNERNSERRQDRRGGERERGRR
jgi:hypothetical protein